MRGRPVRKSTIQPIATAQSALPLGSIFCYTGLKHPSGKKQKFPIKKKKKRSKTNADIKAPPPPRRQF